MMPHRFCLFVCMHVENMPSLYSKLFNPWEVIFKSIILSTYKFHLKITKSIASFSSLCKNQIE